MPDEYSLVNKVAGRLFVQAGAKPRTALEIWSSAYVLLDPVLFKLFLLYYFLGLVQESSFFFLRLLSSTLLDCCLVRVGTWHLLVGPSMYKTKEGCFFRLYARALLRTKLV